MHNRKMQYSTALGAMSMKKPIGPVRKWSQYNYKVEKINYVCNTCAQSSLRPLRKAFPVLWVSRASKRSMAPLPTGTVIISEYHWVICHGCSGVLWELRGGLHLSLILELTLDIILGSGYKDRKTAPRCSLSRTVGPLFIKTGNIITSDSNELISRASSRVSQMWANKEIVPHLWKRLSTNTDNWCLTGPTTTPIFSSMEITLEEKSSSVWWGAQTTPVFISPLKIDPYKIAPTA